MSNSELRTVAQIRSAAAMKTNKSVKGASPLTAMNSLRRLAEEAHLKEQQGDFKGALYQFIQVTVWVATWLTALVITHAELPTLQAPQFCYRIT
jgi:hypothetical protein